jgi:ADP-dependent NAD(P)H-hydrate dehydratase / NAD(P)H-hydrate epimerase
VVVLKNGIPDSVLNEIAPKLWENAKPQLPKYSVVGHKYNRGHASIISGSKFNTGASRLAAQAALKVGAGLVTLAGDAEALMVHANHVTAIMLAEILDCESLFKLVELRHVNVICIGPAAGVNQATRECVKVSLATGQAAVLDADALTVCSESSSELFQWIRNLPSRSVIMTPHEGEFEHVFGSSALTSVS